MIDLFVLLTPVLLLAVFALVRFVGCFIKPDRPVASPMPVFNPVGTPDQNNGRTISFSAQPGELLVAFVAAGQDVVTGVAAPGLTFTPIVKETGGGGTSEIWQAVPAAPLNNVVVTANLSTPGSAFVYVVSFSAQDESGTSVPVVIGATGHTSGSDGMPKASLVTTNASSLIFGVGNDFDRATTPQEGATQVIVQPFVTDPPTLNTYWVQRRTDTPPQNTETQIDDTLQTGDHWNLCICEIRV